MYRILIVEDELLIANLLKTYIEASNYKCSGIAIDYEEAIDHIKNNVVDLVFLDVTLFGDKSGIDIAKQININSNIPFIYLTSHSDQSTLALITDTKPIGYLSKPFKQIDVITALNLYFKNKIPEKKHFQLEVGKTIYKINLNQLLYAKSEHVYINLQFTNKKILIRKSLNTLIDLLPKNSLIRINKSEAVNPNMIQKINTSSVKINKQLFKVSKHYIQNLDIYKI